MTVLANDRFGKDATAGFEFSPERLVHLGHRVNAYPVKAIVCNDFFDPCFQDIGNVWVGLVKVWKPHQPTKLDLVLILPVVNVAVLRAVVAVVVHFRPVERCKVRGRCAVPHVVPDDIEHNPNTAFVAFVHQRS